MQENKIDYAKLDDIRRQIKGPQCTNFTLWDQLYMNFITNGKAAYLACCEASRLVKERDDYLRTKERELVEEAKCSS